MSVGEKLLLTRAAGTVGACDHVAPVPKGQKTQDGACAECIAKVLAANVSQKERAMARALESSEARRKAERAQAAEQLAELHAENTRLQEQRDERQRWWEGVCRNLDAVRGELEQAKGENTRLKEGHATCEAVRVRQLGDADREAAELRETNTRLLQERDEARRLCGEQLPAKESRWADAIRDAKEENTRLHKWSGHTDCHADACDIGWLSTEAGKLREQNTRLLQREAALVACILEVACPVCSSRVRVLPGGVLVRHMDTGTHQPCCTASRGALVDALPASDKPAICNPAPRARDVQTHEVAGWEARAIQEGK